MVLLFILLIKFYLEGRNARNIIYTTQRTGTRNPAINPNRSAVTPNTTGIKAPPMMAVIIRPEISLARAGIVSTAMEKISGNIFAKPSPVRKINTKAIISFGEI
jgi:hypothetical protein